MRLTHAQNFQYYTINKYNFAAMKTTKQICGVKITGKTIMCIT